MAALNALLLKDGTLSHFVGALIAHIMEPEVAPSQQAAAMGALAILNHKVRWALGGKDNGGKRRKIACHGIEMSSAFASSLSAAVLSSLLAHGRFFTLSQTAEGLSPQRRNPIGCSWLLATPRHPFEACARSKIQRERSENHHERQCSQAEQANVHPFAFEGSARSGRTPYWDFRRSHRR